MLLVHYDHYYFSVRAAYNEVDSGCVDAGNGKLPLAYFLGMPRSLE